MTLLKFLIRTYMIKNLLMTIYIIKYWNLPECRKDPNLCGQNDKYFILKVK